MSLARLKPIDTRDIYFAELLRSIVSRVVRVDPDAQVLVFGSFVENRFTAASDIDLAIIIHDRWRVRDFLAELYAPGFLSQWPLDLVVLNRSRYEARKDFGGVCVDIATVGVELYPTWKLK